MFILGGQPPRAIELFSLQVENTLLGGLRSIFIKEGLIGFVTTYYKGFNITNTVKIIHRFLPKEVSSILVYYLARIRPFIKQIHLLALKNKAFIPLYLWFKGLKGLWSSNQLSNVLKRESLRVLGPNTQLIIAL